MPASQRLITKGRVAGRYCPKYLSGAEKPILKTPVFQQSWKHYLWVLLPYFSFIGAIGHWEIPSSCNCWEDLPSPFFHSRVFPGWYELVILPLCRAFLCLLRRQQPAEYLLLVLGMPLVVSQPVKLQSLPPTRVFPRSSSASEMLHTGHFVIYLEGSE